MRKEAEKMIIDIYRKHIIGNTEIEEKEQYVSFCCISDIRIVDNVIIGKQFNGEKLIINCDNRNFNYYIKEQ